MYVNDNVYLVYQTQCSDTRFVCYECMNCTENVWKESIPKRTKEKEILGGERNTGFAMIKYATKELTIPINII